jgi:hypothetical protein
MLLSAGRASSTDGRGERRQTSMTDVDVPVRLPLKIEVTAVEQWPRTSTA